MQYQHSYVGIAANNLTGGKAAIDSNYNIILLDDSAPMPTLDEIKAECERLEKASKLRKMSARNLDYIQRKNAEAERQAIDELVAKRKAEILSDAEKSKDKIIERAKARAEAYAQQAEALTGQNKESKN